VQLREILELRMVLGGGVFLALTRRCPLTCAHCSTVSTMDSEEHADGPFRAFVDSFTPDDHPELIYLTGGEALIRPALVRDLTARARVAGTRSVLLSGLFFARGGGHLPQAIARSLEFVDHFTASYDEFHEREVPRDRFFLALHRIRELVPAISLQLTGHGAGDEYLSALVADVRREFNDEVPMLVTSVVPMGRARSWWPAPGEGVVAEHAEIPCPMVYWPVIHYDGTILPCCAQELVARHRPTHLRVGNAATMTWTQTRELLATSPMLRSLRLLGPHRTVEQFAGRPAEGDLCRACLSLSGDQVAAERAAEYFARPAVRLLEKSAQDLLMRDPIHSFFTLAGVNDYREMALLGPPANAVDGRTPTLNRRQM
jgi:pyruvate-formate lyase-activating enzyme